MALFSYNEVKVTLPYSRAISLEADLSYELILFSGADVAARFLIREMPKVIKGPTVDHGEWFWDLISACLEDPYNRSLPDFIYPKYREGLGETIFR